MLKLRDKLELTMSHPWDNSDGRTRVLLLSINVPGYYSLPIRILSLLTHEKLESQVDARYFEVTLDESESAVENQIAMWAPRILAISANIWSMSRITKLCASLKERLPGLVVVMGGQEVSNSVVDHLQSIHSIDYIIDGEGEKPFEEFLRAFSSETGQVDYSKVSGLKYREDGKTKFTGAANVYDRLDEIPSPILAGLAPGDDLGKLKMGVLLEGTRACPFRCAFCFEGNRKEKTRFNSIERLTSEALFLVEQGVSTFHMLDPILCASNTERLRGLNSLLAQVREKQKNAYISVEAYADLITDEVADNMTTCSILDIGLQSINPGTTKALNRPFKREKWLAGVDRLRARSIPFNVYLISGLPYETLSTFLDGIEFVLAAQPTRMFFNELCLLNGTELRIRSKEYGYKHDMLPPYRVRGNRWMQETILNMVQVMAEFVEMKYNLSARSMFCLSPWSPSTDTIPGLWFPIELRQGEIVADGVPISAGNFEAQLPGSSLYITEWETRESLLRFAGGFQLASTNRMKVHLDWKEFSDPDFIKNLINLGIFHFSTTLNMHEPESFADFQRSLKNMDADILAARSIQQRPPIEVHLRGEVSIETAVAAIDAAGIGANIILTLADRPKGWEKVFREQFERMLAKDVWMKPHVQDMKEWLVYHGEQNPESRLVEDQDAIIEKMLRLELILDKENSVKTEPALAGMMNR